MVRVKLSRRFLCRIFRHGLWIWTRGVFWLGLVYLVRLSRFGVFVDSELSVAAVGGPKNFLGGRGRVGIAY